MRKLGIIGSINYDTFYHLNKIPEIGETISSNSKSESPGGKGMNQAVAAARMGTSCTFFGKIGADYKGDILVEKMQCEGINTRFIKKESNESTGEAVIYLDGEGRNSIVTYKGANGMVDEKYLDAHEDKLLENNGLIMQLEIPEETLYKVIELANSNDIKTFINLAPFKELKHKYLSKVDYIIVNEIEAKYLAGIDTQETGKIMFNLRKKFKDTMIIMTLGADGVIAFKGDEDFKVEGKRVKVVDTTGAGDTFCGVFASCILEGKSLEDALRTANNAAAISITKLGAQSGMPNRDELMK